MSKQRDQRYHLRAHIDNLTRDELIRLEHAIIQQKMRLVSDDARGTIITGKHGELPSDGSAKYLSEYTLPEEKIDKENITCPRCNGLGKLLQYKHVENGICFRCKGSGVSYKWAKDK